MKVTLLRNVLIRGKRHAIGAVLDLPDAVAASLINGKAAVVQDTRKVKTEAPALAPVAGFNPLPVIEDGEPESASDVHEEDAKPAARRRKSVRKVAQ